MIRHPIGESTLMRLIRAKAPDFFSDARDILSRLPATPTSKDFESLWGEVKPVYMDLQGGKCVYCEMPLEGRIANDLEHFRPKTRVKHWKPPRSLEQSGIQITSVADRRRGDPGYYYLAYEPLNYAASCKLCNSNLKKNYFPIRGAWKKNATAVDDTRREDPYLIYPIGDRDVAPEDLIAFEGIVPHAKGRRNSHGYFRAQTTIEIFQLNDRVNRKDLFRARATTMDHLYKNLVLRDRASDQQELDDADFWISSLTDRTSPHSNCMRCFCDVYANDAARAKELTRAASKFVRSGSAA